MNKVKVSNTFSSKKSPLLIFLFLLFFSKISYSNNFFEDLNEKFQSKVFQSIEQSSSTNKLNNSSTTVFAPGDICATLTANEVGGTVWEDLDNNGVIDDVPLNGLSGVTISVFDCNNTLMGTTTTNGDGDWSFNVSSRASCNGCDDVRIEYSNLPAVYKPTEAGTDNGTKVQFIQPGNCGSLGVLDIFASCAFNGGTGAVGDAARWIYIGDTLNPVDGPAYSTTVNGSPVVHNDPDQVGRGAVNYEYWILDNQIRISDYLEFLNAIDPANGPERWEAGLVTNSLAPTVQLIEYDVAEPLGSRWKTIAYTHAGQNISAADMEKVAVSYISFSLAARYANWIATGDINQGAYTFDSPTSATANITAVDNNFPEARLPTEDELYKALYWDQPNLNYNLYGTTTLLGTGIPVFSDVDANGLLTVPTGNVYNLTSHGTNEFHMIQTFQGGQTPYGLYFGVGDFHDMALPFSPTFPLATNVVRPDNQFRSEALIRSSFRLETTLTMNDYYPSPSYRMAASSNPCVQSLEIGNYIWEDTNGNGIQDACESGIMGLTVQLYDETGSLKASTVTDANGQYYFSDSDEVSQTWVSSPDKIEENTAYYIVVGNGLVNDGVMTFSGNEYVLTDDNINSGDNQDERDSDATIASGLTGGLSTINGLPYFRVRTMDWGFNDHSFDMGFVLCPSLNASGSNPTTCGGSDGSINLTFTNVPDGTYTINYDDATPSSQTFSNVMVSSNSATIAGLNAGTYNNLTITANSCTSSDDVDVVLTDPNTPNIALGTTSNPTICMGMDGTIQITGMSPTTNYTLNYLQNAVAVTPTSINSDGSGNYLITGLSAGSFTNINVTLAGCTSNNLATTLSDPPTPTLAATPTNPTTCGGTDGSIDFTFTNVSDGTYNIDYQDATPSTQTFMNVAVSNNSATVNGLAAGTYNDLMITISGCTSTENVDLTLSDPPTPTLAASANNPTTCSGTDGSIDFTFTNVPDGTYNIDYQDATPSTQTFMNVAVSNNSATVNGLAAGTYNDLIITISGCTSTENVDLTLSDPPTPTLAASANNPTACSGTDGSIDFTFTNVPDGTYNIDYQDATPTTQTFMNVTVLNNSATVNGLAAGTYNDLIITISGCTSMEDVDISLNDPNAPSIVLGTTSNPTTCMGIEGTIQITGMSPTTAYTLNYQKDAVSVTPTAIVSDGSGNYIINNLSAGNYSNINVTLLNCTSNNLATTLSDPPTPTLAATPTNPTTCGGTDGSIDFTFTNVPDGTYNIDYQDATPTTQTFMNVTVSNNSATVSGLTAGTYNNLMITANSCTSNEDVDINLSDPSGMTLNTTSIAETCDLNDGSIEVTVSGGATPYDISWDNGSGTSGNAMNQPSPYTIPNLPAGIYNITVTDNINCSAITAESVMAATNCCPTLSNPSADVTICEGQTVTTLSVDTDAMTPTAIDFVYFTTQQTGSEMYSGGTSVGIVEAMSGTASVSDISLATPTTYYFYAIISPTPPDTGCRPFQEIEVTINPNPDLSLTVSDPEICDGDDAPIIVSNSEIGFNYQLRLNSNDSNVGSAIAGTGGDITFTVSGLSSATGTYEYNVFAMNSTTGCSGELSDLSRVIVNNCDMPTFFFPQPFCPTTPCHVIDPNIQLGAANMMNDGVVFPNNIRPNITIRVPITIVNNTGNPSYLTGWIDWNGDNDFDDPGEQIADETYLPGTYSGTFTISLPISVPSDANLTDQIGSRFRVSTDNVNISSPCGSASCAADGEVEDYLIQVECPPEICLPIQISTN